MVKESKHIIKNNVGSSLGRETCNFLKGQYNMQHFKHDLSLNVITNNPTFPEHIFAFRSSYLLEWNWVKSTLVGPACERNKMLRDPVVKMRCHVVSNKQHRFFVWHILTIESQLPPPWALDPDLPVAFQPIRVWKCFNVLILVMVMQDIKCDMIKFSPVSLQSTKISTNTYSTYELPEILGSFFS